jgi:hypothetical protein
MAAIKGGAHEIFMVVDVVMQNSFFHLNYL